MLKCLESNTVAQYVLQYCQVENVEADQSGRKVPLPIEENLNQKSIQLEKLILQNLP